MTQAEKVEKNSDNQSEEVVKGEEFGSQAADLAFGDKDTEAAEIQATGLEENNEEEEGAPQEPGVPQSIFQEVQEKHLRALADIENLKRFHSGELQSVSERAQVNIIEELLPILDNFSRALDFTTDNKEVKNFLIGMKMVRDQFLDSLGRFGLTKESSLGQKFDPEKHEAMELRFDEDKEEGIVLEEIQPGYFLKEKLVRPAKVIVNQKPSE